MNQTNHGPLRDAVLCMAAAAGLTGVAVFRLIRRSASQSRLLVGGLSERLDHLHQRIDWIDQATAERATDLAARIAALGEPQNAAEASLADAHIVLNALAQKLAGVADRLSSFDALVQRVDFLERRVTRLQEEADGIGAMAATAVAASDEVDVLAPSLRDLRRELIQLGRQVQEGLDALQDTLSVKPAEAIGMQGT